MCKKRGYMLLSAITSSIVAIMLAGAFFIIYGGQFSMIQSGRTALAAQQYAEIDANTLRLTSYDELDDVVHSRQSITEAAEPGWEDEISIAAEKIIDEDADNRQRIATINIYKEGDTLARYSLQVPLSSQGSGLKKGMIISWYGQITDIPSGWLLCDGTHGTPDLRDRFIIGAGNAYQLNDIGGEATHVLTINEIPSHNHTGDDVFNKAAFDASGLHTAGTATSGFPYSLAIGDNMPYNNIWHYFETAYTGGNQSHNNLPPYYGLYFIIKN